MPTPLLTHDQFARQGGKVQSHNGFRQVAHSLIDNRAIVGGGDVPFTTAHKSDQLIAQKTRILQRRFSDMFPRMNLEVSYTWAGTFGETKDGLAYIGQTPEFLHAYFVLGYGGNGITFSVIAAKIITEFHLG